MKKKLFKYIKFIVSLTLILSLVAPSYASLSASDGSAFVTKAEFDSALADFNARLTTFEAGINSKIDSQVTSYLDRNGIWSGKDQDLDGSGLVEATLGRAQVWSMEEMMKGYTKKYYGESLTTRQIYANAVANKFWSNHSAVNNPMSTTWTKKEYVKTLNKSGLCLLVYDVFNAVSSNVSGSWNVFDQNTASGSGYAALWDIWAVDTTSTNGTDFFLTGAAFQYVNIEVDKATGDTAQLIKTLNSSIVPKNWAFLNSSDTALGARTSVSPTPIWGYNGSFTQVKNKNEYFFVEKGQKICAYPEISLNLNSDNAKTIMGSGKLVVYAYNSIGIGVRKCVVY